MTQDNELGQKARREQCWPPTERAEISPIPKTDNSSLHSGHWKDTTMSAVGKHIILKTEHCYHLGYLVCTHLGYWCLKFCSEFGKLGFELSKMVLRSLYKQSDVGMLGDASECPNSSWI